MSAHLLFLRPLHVPPPSWSQACAATGVKDVLDGAGCTSCEQIVDFAPETHQGPN